MWCTERSLFRGIKTREEKKGNRRVSEIDNEKALIGNYASENGVAKVVRHSKINKIQYKIGSQRAICIRGAH